MFTKYIESLKKIGLTKSEAEVYLSLIELKESRTGALCKRSKVPSSKIYVILNSLIEKGFVSYRVQNNVKVFIPSSPEMIKKIFKEKQKSLLKEEREMDNLIKNLKLKQVGAEPFSKYRYFEGISGIRAMWVGLTEELPKFSKKEPILMYAGIRKSYESMLGLYEEFHKVRLKNKIKYKIIYPIEENIVAEKRKKQLAKVKFAKLENEAEWGVLEDKFFIQYITKKIPRGFLIEDEVFANTFRQVFNQIWKNI